jgi:hypothetical protein
MAARPADRARPDSWQTRPMPESVARVAFADSYSAEEYAAIVRGFIPQEMEDKWFIYEDRSAVYFHRSWTGACIYRVRFEAAEDRYRVVEVLVSRDPEQYKGDDEQYEERLVRFLIDNLLLGRQTPFPLPARAPDIGAELFQFHVAGTAYPVSRDSIGRSKL